MNARKTGPRAASTVLFFLASAALCLLYLLWFGPAFLQLEPWAWQACLSLCTVIFLPPVFPLGEALQAILQGRTEALGSCCRTAALLQIPALLLWGTLFFGYTIDMFGIPVPGFAGLLIHLALLIWGLANAALAKPSGGETSAPSGDWREDFLSQVLANIRPGPYRDRLAGELGGHLEALALSLEDGGLPTEEARSQALERMGEREELRKTCREEFLRRLYTPKYRAAHLAALLYFVLLLPLCVEYIINTNNFGKGWPATWGYTAILISVVAFTVLSSACPGQRAGWNVLEGCFGLCVLMQGPPLFWWALYAGGAFEFSGVMVPGYVGFPVHAALLAGALAGMALTKHCRTGFGLTY